MRARFSKSDRDDARYRSLSIQFSPLRSNRVSRSCKVKWCSFRAYKLHDLSPGRHAICWNQAITRFDRDGAATADSSRLHIDSLDDPSDSTPRVASSGVGTISAVLDSSTLASSGRFVVWRSRVAVVAWASRFVGSTVDFAGGPLVSRVRREQEGCFLVAANYSGIRSPGNSRSVSFPRLSRRFRDGIARLLPETVYVSGP
jgi:hypothetical protein